MKYKSRAAGKRMRSLDSYTVKRRIETGNNNAFGGDVRVRLLLTRRAHTPSTQASRANYCGDVPSLVRSFMSLKNAKWWNESLLALFFYGLRNCAS